MKRFNKILALVLAMTMMFCVVSICASAADTENAAYKVEFVDNDGNPITEVAAGGFANVIISIKTDGYSNNFAFHGFYDVNKLTQIRYDGNKIQNIGAKVGELQGRFNNTGVWADAPDDLLAYEDDQIGNSCVYDWGYSGSIVMSTHADSMYTPDFTDAQKAQYKGVYLSYTTYQLMDASCVKVNTEGNFAKLVRFRFMANVDTALNKDVFFLTEHPSFTNIYIDPKDEPLGNIRGQVLPTLVSNLTIEYPAGGSSEAKPVVSNLETQVRWQDKNAGLLDIGFCGSVSGLTPELDTDGVTVKNVERVGFKFSRTDATLTNNVTTVDAYTLYDFTAETAGTYKFRAVVTGDDLDYKKTDALYACAFIQIGSEEILATNAKIDTTINAEYLDAVNNHNMPAFGA